MPNGGEPLRQPFTLPLGEHLGEGPDVHGEGVDLASAPADTRGGLRRNPRRLHSGCAAGASCLPPEPPGAPRRWRLRRSTVPDRGRPLRRPLREPSGQARGFPVRQQVHWTPAFDVGQDGPVVAALRVAYSPTPTTRGAGTSGSGKAPTSRSNVLRLTDKPKIPAMRVSARPASVRPTAASVDRRRSVRQPYRRVSPDQDFDGPCPPSTGPAVPRGTPSVARVRPAPAAPGRGARLVRLHRAAGTPTPLHRAAGRARAGTVGHG